MLTNSLVGYEIVHLPCLVGSEYCLVDGYKEWLGMELIVLIRFAQWVLDFAESLFEEDQDHIMDMLATVGRALDQLCLIVRRGTSDAWRANENGLSRTEYSQKLLANNEEVTSLYTLSSKGCFSLEFLAGSIARPKGGSDKDTKWLGSYRRHQPTEEGIERVGKHLAGLFDKLPTPPLQSNPFAILPPALSQPAVSSASADGHVILPHPSKDHKSPPKSLRPTANSHVAKSPRPQGLFASCPASPIAQTRSSIWREASLSLRSSVDDPDKRAASLLNTLTRNRLPNNDEAKPLAPLRPHWKTSAMTAEEVNDDHLQESTLCQTEEQSLVGLVNGLWKVVATRPEPDNTLTRRKVADVLKDLKEQARGEKLQEGVQMATSKGGDGSDAPRKVKKDGQTPGRASGLQFLRKLF